MINHQDNFGTNLTSGTNASDTTSPLNSIPSISAPFYLAFDATNINGHYEVKQITSKTATNVLHSALSYDHTTAEEVRMVLPATELDALDTAVFSALPSGWVSYSTVVPTRASADDPTYVLTFAGVDLTSTMGVGMKVKWTQNSTVRYGIITAISFSTNTTVTLYGGTDYDVDDTGTYAISAFHYSTQKAPLSFPLDPTKWTFKVTDTTQRTTSGSAGTWNNVGGSNAQIAIPIGAWDVDYRVEAYGDRTTAGTGDSIYITLSTANNSQSDGEFTGRSGYSGGAANESDVLNYVAFFRKSLVLASKTTYYLNMKMDNAGSWTYNNNISPMVIRAVCAYL